MNQPLLPWSMPTRCFNGETITSYARRHAARNHVPLKEADTWLRSSDTYLSYSPFHPDRVQAWREIGGLHQSAFTTPKSLSGNWISERALCLGCTKGQAAYGALPRAGNICLRHRRWLPAPTQPAVTDRAVLAAERHFRSRLAAKHVLFDSPPMRLAYELAAVTTDGAFAAAERDRTGLPEAAVLYASQVRFATLLTSRSFLSRITDPNVDGEERNKVIRERVLALTPDSDEMGRWRAEGRIQHVAHRLQRARMDATYRDLPVRDDEWNLVRHLDLGC